MKIKAEVGMYEDMFNIGITFWLHSHYSDKHFHIILELFFWWLEITFGDDD